MAQPAVIAMTRLGGTVDTAAAHAEPAAALRLVRESIAATATCATCSLYLQMSGEVTVTERAYVCVCVCVCVEGGFGSGSALSAVMNRGSSAGRDRDAR